MRQLAAFLLRPRVVLAAYLLAAIVATAQDFRPGGAMLGGQPYTNYNNYVIFKQAFHHLVDGLDLYVSYPGEHWDLFKYSPTFALLFGIFAGLPDPTGLFLWNLLNFGTVFVALSLFPETDTPTRSLLLWFVALELLTSVQNSQSNGLVAGLMILVFVCLERRAYLLAALMAVAAAYVKLFGIAAILLFLLYPGKRRLAAYAVGWTILLGALPAAVVPVSDLWELYRGWLDLLASDHQGSLGLSVLGWLNAWFAWRPDKVLVVALGALLLLVPLARVTAHKAFTFRALALASILVWVVIFNHKAESPTFIIAISGVAIWYFAQQRRPENLVLLVLAFILTSMSPTDLFPAYLRTELVRPYTLKAVPCILVWLKIVWDMMSPRGEPPPRSLPRPLA